MVDPATWRAVEASWTRKQRQNYHKQHNKWIISELATVPWPVRIREIVPTHRAALYCYYYYFFDSIQIYPGVLIVSGWCIAIWPLCSWILEETRKTRSYNIMTKFTPLLCLCKFKAPWWWRHPGLKLWKHYGARIVWEQDKMTRVKLHIAKFVPKVIMVIFYRLSKLVIVAKYLALTRGISAPKQL